MKHPTRRSYIIGFILSLLLTGGAYVFTEVHVSSFHRVISHVIFIPLILGFALTQLVVQMIFFLNLWNEKKPRWNLVFFVSTVGLILLIVVAAIWIMQHLNYNMTPTIQTHYLLKDEGIHY